MPVVGKNAAINGYHCITDFQLELSGTDTAGACSATDGAVIRGIGNSDWNVMAVGYGHTPPAFPNDLVTFEGNDSNGEGWESSAEGGIVSKVHIICPTRQGDFIYYRMFIAATGSMTAGTPGATDTPPQSNPLSSKGLGVQINGEQDAVIGWELIIDGNLTDPDWNSSSVEDGDGNVWPIRGAGNIDALIRYSQRIPNTTSLPVLHELVNVKLEATSTLYWDINWGRLLKLPVRYNIKGERGKGEFITAEEITLGFTGWSGSTKGYIKTPASAYVWGD